MGSLRRLHPAADRAIHRGGFDGGSRRRLRAQHRPTPFMLSRRRRHHDSRRGSRQAVRRRAGVERRLVRSAGRPHHRLLGHNGAGKSTTLRILSTVCGRTPVAPSSTVTIASRSRCRFAVARRCCRTRAALYALISRPREHPLLRQAARLARRGARSDDGRADRAPRRSAPSPGDARRAIRRASGSKSRWRVRSCISRAPSSWTSRPTGSTSTQFACCVS